MGYKGINNKKPSWSPATLKLLLLIFSSIIAQITTFSIKFNDAATAQTIIPAADGTNTLVNQNGNQINITGGTLSGNGANLFHSFQRFGLNQNQIANFLSNPNIQNILGRVVGGDPSVINGLIQVTGGTSNLYLMNPAGIVFGSNASLNVPASFTATTATSIGFGNNFSFNSIGANDYANLIGNPTTFNFNINQPGSIVNGGNLQVSTGENLSLIGGNVINTGTLTAPQGNITIAAVPGSSLVRISQPGNLLSLEIDPNAATGGINALTLPQLLTGSRANVNTGLTFNNSGEIALNNSGANIASNGGVTVASGNINTSGHTGGTINIIGNKVEVINSNINASGTNGGGTVLIGGDYQGKGTIPNSQTTFIDKNSQINADAVTNGNGGKVIVWSDQKTQFEGNITARGGSQSGNGGFAEVSGKQKLTYTGFTDLSASNGQTGNLLLDPDTFTIANTGGDIDPATVASQWNTANQTYQATTSLTVTDAVVGASGFNLTLDAPTINLNAPITNTGTGQLSGTANTVNVGANGSIQNGVDVAATDGKVNLAGATYTLSQQIDIDKSLTVAGAGVDNTTVSGNNAVRVFNISGTGTTVNIDGLTITNGKADDGGGILVETGNTLNLSNSTLSNNSATSQGGAIRNKNGTVTVTNSTLSGNSAIANGGGIDNFLGTTKVSNSTFSGNSSNAIGGAISSNGTVTVSNSTISNNSAQSGGGFNNGGTLTIVNSTLSGNSAKDFGGGIYNNGGSTATVKNSIVAGNTAVTGAEISNINNSTFTSQGYNLVGQNGNAGEFPTIDSDIVLSGSIDTAIAPLGNYGGTTQTHALVAGSPAIDAGDNTGATNTDQRGGQRGGFGGLNAGEKVDIGAFEATSSYLVTNTNDGTNPGVGSLRGALSFFNGNNINNNPANSPANTDTIQFDTTGTFATPQTITLTAGELALTRSIRIEGTGKSNLSISGNNTSRVFNISGSGTYVNIRSLTIANGNAVNGNGGGIQLENGSILNLFNSVLSGNSASGEGGAIHNNNSSLTVYFSTLSKNSALNGGGIYNNNGTVAVDSTLSDNSATNYGGGIYNNTGTVTVTDSTLSGNSAIKLDGGGIFNKDGTITVTDSTLSGNSAANYGGGIFNAGTAGTITLNNTTLSDNSTVYGSGIYNDGIATIKNSTLSKNTATAQGGGIFNNAGNITVTNTTLSDNTATSEGGGIYNNSGTTTIANSTLSGNSTVSGGGIYNNSGTTTIDNSTLFGNSVTLQGGGIFNNTAATLAITNSTLSNNSATAQGGGIFNNGGAVTVKNSIVAGNTTLSSDAEVSNNATFTSLGYNLVGQNGDVGGFPTTANDIVLNGSIDTAIAPLGNYGGSTQTHALVAGSPAIDAGDNTEAPTTDQRGGQRGAFGGLNAGNRIDIGAFEATSSYLVTNTDDSINPGVGSLRGALSFLNGNTNNNQTNSAGSIDTIRFDTNGIFAQPQTISLMEGELVLTRSVNIEGTGASNLSISGSNVYRIFNISGNGTDITIDGLTITRGNSFRNNGGAIQVGSGSTLNLINSNISSNGSSIASSGVSFGGGIYNAGTTTITNSTITNNFAQNGAGIYNSSTLTIKDSTLSNNTAFQSGGGIFNIGTATVTNSKSTGNSAQLGVGVFNSGTLTIDSTAFTDKSATQADGATINNTNGTLSLNNNSNISGGNRGLYVSGSSSSILLDNISFSGQSGDYITLFNGAIAGKEIDATTVRFDNIIPNNATLTQLFAVEDKITHGVDSSGLGLLRIKDDNVYVTSNSGSIQKALDVASIGNTINIATSTYTEPLNINKSVDLIFDGAGSTLNGDLITTEGSKIGLAGILTANEVNFSRPIDLLNDFTLTANNITFSQDVTSSSSGSITLLAKDNITTSNISTSSGEIKITSQNGFIQTGNLTTNSPDLAANITVEAPGNVTTGTVSTTTNLGSAGSVFLKSANGAVEAGDINTNSANGDGGFITVMARDRLTTKVINSSSQIANGGAVTLDPDNDIVVTSINTQGGINGNGGNVNITTKRFFRAEGTFIDNNNIISSISTSGGTGSGAVTINHGNNIFVVGDASTNGTAGAIVSTSGNIIATTRFISGNYTQGNIQINSSFLFPEEPTVSRFIDTSILDLLNQSKPINAEPIELTDSLFSQLSEKQAIEQLEKIYFEEYTSFLELSNKKKAIKIEEIQAILRKNQQITGVKSAIIYINFANQNCLKPTGNIRVVQDSDVLCIGVVTAEGLPTYQVVEGATRKKVMSIVGRLRSEITDPDNTRSTKYLTSAQQLYKLLIAPREEILQKQGINNLMFVMDEGLRTLSLAVLHDGQQFLIEKYSLALIPSFSLTDTEYKGIKKAEVLAMGAAKFTADQKQSELRAVPIELSTVTRKFEGQFFLNQEFTLNNLQRQRTIKPYPIIHLATHADFPLSESGNKNQPYIQLYNQKLQLNQIEQLGWKNPAVELLVLSACKSAVGDAAAELGFAGFAVKSGVKTAVASLWYVSDPGTFGLMTEFYNQLRNAPIKAEALRQAQIAMIKNQVKLEGNEFVYSQGRIPVSPELAEYLRGYIKGNLSHPYYWAAFNVVGSPW
jgi:CHAT domain-containing protein